ncbi:MAG: PHP domain-containing protein [Hadesarchaea archaeon]|nr:PHP domain-containing protein [Hadesarchaea archaeon]
MLRIDMHVHTSHSYDGLCSVEDAVKAAKAKGLNGIAITDHNTISGHHEAKKFSKRSFIIIPGVEISSADGHILGLGVNELVPQELSARETVKRIKEQGGIAIAAHPFALGRKPNLVYRAKFDAIEAFNSRALFFSNPLARRFAERNRFPMVAGSDAHHRDEIGLASTTLNCKPNIDSILEQIRRGETSISGRTLPLSIFLWRVFQRIPHRSYER